MNSLRPKIIVTEHKHKAPAVIGSDSTTPTARRSLQLPCARSTVYGNTDMFGNGVRVALSTPDASPTTQDNDSNTVTPGMVKIPHPVNYNALYALKDISGHHSSCIQAKKYCTVGLGFVTKKDGKQGTPDPAGFVASLLKGEDSISGPVDDKLDPLTNFGFLHELLCACEDFMDTGNGHLEVARNAKGDISGISYTPSVYLHACTLGGRLFYEYSPFNSGSSLVHVGSGACGGSKYFALFGNKEWLLTEGPLKDTDTKPEEVSEIIPFIMPSNRVQNIGFPDWLSACTDIDLLKLAKQYKGDFFANRGVIDKFLCISGEEVNDDAYDAIQTALSDSVGGGNNFTSFFLNLLNPEAKAELLDLGAGDKEEQYAQDVETFTQSIVSSHRVPPLLANILIPGKLGSSNEFLNSVLAFDGLVILPYQAVFERMLGKTLGSKGAGLGLTPEVFKLRNITAQINVASMETVGSMRSEATDPANADRDLSKGAKD